MSTNLGLIANLERIWLAFPTNGFIHFGEWKESFGRAVVATLHGPPAEKAVILPPSRVDLVNLTGCEYVVYRGGIGNFAASQDRTRSGRTLSN